MVPFATGEAVTEGSSGHELVRREVVVFGPGGRGRRPPSYASRSPAPVSRRISCEGASSTVSSELRFSSTRVSPGRKVVRVVGWLLTILVVVVVAWALLVGGLWGYAWIRLGADDVPALRDDDALGATGARAPEQATTVLVALTDEVDPTVPREPELEAPLALVQFGGPRDEPAVLVLPRELPVSIDGMGEVALEDVQLEGGSDLLVRSIVDYTGVHVDHVVSLSIDALPRLVDAMAPLEVCGSTGCSEPTGDEVRTALRSNDDAEQLRVAADVLRAIGGAFDTRFAVTSPVATKRVVDAVAEEVSTDVGLRGSRVLDVASALAGAGTLDVDTVPLVVNPDTGTVLPMEEPAMVRFQHLQEGTALDGSAAGTDELEADLIAEVEVAVLNGAGIDGLAGQVQVELEASGFVVIGTGNAPAFDRSDSVVNYVGDDPVAEYVAGELAEVLGDVTLEPLEAEPTFDGEPVDLLVTVGEDLAD